MLISGASLCTSLSPQFVNSSHQISLACIINSRAYAHCVICRDEIAGCSEKAYDYLSVKDAQQMLLFSSERELLEYIREVSILATEVKIYHFKRWGCLLVGLFILVELVFIENQQVHKFSCIRFISGVILFFSRFKYFSKISLH